MNSLQGLPTRKRICTIGSIGDQRISSCICASHSLYAKNRFHKIHIFTRQFIKTMDGVTRQHHVPQLFPIKTCIIIQTFHGCCLIPSLPCAMRRFHLKY